MKNIPLSFRTRTESHLVSVTAIGFVLTGLLWMWMPVGVHASDNELSRTSIVDERTLTFAEGPAAKFSCTANGRTHQQTPLTTYRGYQYVTYYNAQRQVCLGRRKLPSGPWEIIRFDDHRFETNDSHNAAVIGICDKDGTIHMVFDHHASQLNYRVSKLGAAHDPESTQWNADLFGPVTHTLGSVAPAERVTYPRLVSTPGGDLLLYYRGVTSADGDGMMEKYDGDRHDWTDGLGKFIARDVGTYQFADATSTRRCPYVNAFTYAGQRLHISWVWRDKFERTLAVNQHDLCYAYSDDDGQTWMNNDGEVIAKTGSEFIHLDTPGLVVAPIPSHSGLANQNTHFAYPDGTLHVVMRHRVAGDLEGTWESRYHHHWRDHAGAWHQAVMPFSGRRPKLLGTRDRTLILIYTDDEELDLAKGTPNADHTGWTWTKLRLPERHSCYGDAVVDFQRWEADNVLSLYSQAEPSRLIETNLPGPIDGFPARLEVTEYEWNQLPETPIR